jgi:benzoate 4-monooxygenase
LAAQQTKAHRAREDNHLDILGYLEIVRKEKPVLFSDSDLVNMLTSNVFASSDTTSISPRAIVHFILSNTNCLRKFQQELKSRTEAGLPSNPVCYEEERAWPLLQAIMDESLRLHSSFAIHLPRVVPEKGLMVDRYYLPPGQVGKIHPSPASHPEHGSC